MSLQIKYTVLVLLDSKYRAFYSLCNMSVIEKKKKINIPINATEIQELIG